jgi:serine/threonine-protein kinase
VDPERYERVQQLFHDAVDLPDDERRAFLARECADDAELAAQVSKMIDTDARRQMLDRDVAEVAGPLFTGDRAAPDRVGPYKITKVIGEGGMGVVYAAVREDLGSIAAVKVLRDAWVSPERRDRFAAEQRTLAQLNHPHIARLYDAGAFPDGTPWIVMEYVDGVPLTDYCRTHAHSIAERLRLFRDVCDAVQHAHRHLVLHRDLKPSNILVTKDGQVKLLDFGIAKQLENLDTPAAATLTGLRLMTPVYASPERLRGAAAGIDADVYSLGVILYELLAGKLPFEVANRTPGEIEAAILGPDPARPSVVARGGTASAATRLATPKPARAEAGRAAWADLDVLCLTAMHRDAERRYATVDALGRDIDRFLKGDPLEARPDAFGYRLGKLLRRRRREVAAAAVVFLVVAGLIAFYTVRLTVARNDALTNLTRAQRIQQFMLNLFAGGDPEAGPSADLRVATLVDRGAREARSLASEPAVQADLYQTLGSIYQKLGNFERSDELLREALARRQALKGLTGAAGSDVAETLTSRALLFSDKAQFDEAERLAREALATARTRLRNTDPTVVRALVALGKVQSDRGKYDDAIVTLDEAVRLQTVANAEPQDRASSLYELASAHFYAGHYDQSEVQNQQALALYKQVYGDKHPLVSDCLINLGAIQYERGKDPDAERYYREGIAITEGWFGRDHYQTAANLTMLARVLNRTPERQVEARAVLGEALAIRERVYGPEHPRVASTVNELGAVALGAGRLDEAEQYFLRVTAIYRKVHGDTHYQTGIGLSNLASTYMAQKKFAQAEKLFREALVIYTKTLPATHTNIGIARIKLGRTLLRQQRYTEAAAESLGGYEILKPQMDPGVSWLKSARTDLIEAYEALKQPDQAAKFKAEQTAIAK